MRSRVATVAATVGNAAFLAAVPAALIYHSGLPNLGLPSADAVRAFIRQPLTSGFILTLAHSGAWSIWALLAAAIAVHSYRRLARALRWLPALHLPAPLQHLAAVMLGATAVSAATGGMPAHAAAGPTSTGDDTPHPATRSAGHATPSAVRAAGTSGPEVAATHTVARGDTLSGIAQRRLGDDDRWPEIFTLNRGTHFPDVGGTLRDPDVIYPGWTLELPAATAPPAGQQPRQAPPKPPPTTQPNPESSTPAPATAAPTTAGPAASTAPHAPITSQACPNTAATPTAAGDTGTANPIRDSDTRGQRPAHGVSLPSGSWVDVGLALAIAAAVALVWAHRQRRYVPREPSMAPRLDDPDLAPMPRVVGQIRRGLRRATGQPDTAGDDACDPREDNNTPATTAPDEEVPDSAAVLPVAPALAHPLSAVWPPAGLGLTGPGAHAAARGLLTAALTAGGAEHPDARTQVVMPSATAATLLGGAAVNLPHTPRLTVTAGLDDALRILEEQTMHRTRLLYRHEVDTVTEPRAVDPCEEPVAPVMLLADATGRHERTRIAALLAQGQRLDIHGVLLGAWPDGNTVDVAADGTTTPADGDARHASHPADVGRLAVLNATETIDLLATLAESHTGRPPAPAPTEASPAPAPPRQADGPCAPPDRTRTTGHPVEDSSRDTATQDRPDAQAGTGATTTTAATEADSAVADTPTAVEPPTPHTDTISAATDGVSADTDTSRTAGQPSTTADPGHCDETRRSGEQAPPPASEPQRVTVTVLGPPAIVGADPRRNPRAKSLELLVYLAVRDGSASAEAILDDLLPDAPASKALHRLHTYVSDLRAVLRHNAGPGTYLTHPHHRYQLNPDRFDVDLWRMRAAIRAADAATTRAERIDALRRAVTTYRPLAEGCDYEWLEPHRQTAQREALDATAALVEELADQPDAQAAVCDTALGQHPYAETLYQTAMRAHARLGHLDTVRALRRTLTRRLAEIDAEPADDTLTLADRLIADLPQPRHRRGRTPSQDGTPA